MLDLNKRPEPPVREIDPVAEVIALAGDGVEFQQDEIEAAEVGQAELDEAYVEAFAAYEEADEAFCVAYAEKTGKRPDGERPARQETAKERIEREGGGKPRENDDAVDVPPLEDEDEDKGKEPPGQAKR